VLEVGQVPPGDFRAAGARPQASGEVQSQDIDSASRSNVSRPPSGAASRVIGLAR
jgi:hypothetical protein